MEENKPLAEDLFIIDNGSLDKNLPKRKKYSKIESFEEYELTSCVVYEMAIRNKEFQAKLSEFNTLKSLKYDDDNLHNLELAFLADSIRKEFLIDPNIMGKGQYKIGDEKESESFHVKREKGFFATSFYKDDDIEYSKVIEPSFSRPPINYYHEDGSENHCVNLNNVNLKLPENELIAYIKHIKTTFDKNQGIIKTPLELLGFELNIEDFKYKYKKMKSTDWADSFFIYDFFKASKNNYETNISDISKLLTQHKGVKVKIRGNSHTVPYKYYLEKKDYFNTKGATAFFGNSTIAERYKIMKYLIDEKKYKNLVI